MNRAVICGEGLGKRYRRGMVQSSGLLRDSLGRILKAPLRAFQGQKRETFWALKDVSIEVREGEVLGLIGRNGAGKTTLLKILSRITQPTAGWAEIHGRVGSLLEVGTGFHPELTGRENTFLSGAILGMSKSEINRKFDEIVAFAELEKFIDTPVKHYSSGMYVRLAFAVAAHLEPEILLVDEVLAVGDINFQKKCLGKMGDVAKAGRTVVLVTHQMNQIRRLCHRVIWIDSGEKYQDGDAADVLGAYMAAMNSGERAAGDFRRGTKAQFLRWAILDEEQGQTNVLCSLDPVRISFWLEVRTPVTNIHHGIALYDQNQQLLWGTATDGLNLATGQYQFEYALPSLPLRPGIYDWRVSLYDGADRIDDWNCLPQMVVSTRPYTHYKDEWAGSLNIPSELNVRFWLADSE